MNYELKTWRSMKFRYGSPKSWRPPKKLTIYCHITTFQSNPIQSLFNRSDPQPAIRLLHIGNQLFWRSGLQALPGKEVRPWRTIRCELGMPFFQIIQHQKIQSAPRGLPFVGIPKHWNPLPSVKPQATVYGSGGTSYWVTPSWNTTYTSNEVFVAPCHMNTWIE